MGTSQVNRLHLEQSALRQEQHHNTNRRQPPESTRQHACQAESTTSPVRWLDYNKVQRIATVQDA